MTLKLQKIRAADDDCGHSRRGALLLSDDNAKWEAVDVSGCSVAILIHYLGEWMALDRNSEILTYGRTRERCLTKLEWLFN